MVAGREQPLTIQALVAICACLTCGAYVERGVGGAVETPVPLLRLNMEDFCFDCADNGAVLASPVCFFREARPLMIAWIEAAASSSEGSFDVCTCTAVACFSALAFAAFAFRAARPRILAWIEEAAPSADGIFQSRASWSCETVACRAGAAFSLKPKQEDDLLFLLFFDLLFPT